MKQNMQWRVWKIKEKERREKFKDKVKKLVNNEAKNLWGLFKDGVWRLVKNFVEREKEEESEEAYGGGMRKCKK